MGESLPVLGAGVDAQLPPLARVQVLLDVGGPQRVALVGVVRQGALVCVGARRHGDLLGVYDGGHTLSASVNIMERGERVQGLRKAGRECGGGGGGERRRNRTQRSLAVANRRWLAVTRWRLAVSRPLPAVNPTVHRVCLCVCVCAGGTQAV